jgi:hypothetical protein
MHGEKNSTVFVHCDVADGFRVSNGNLQCGFRQPGRRCDIGVGFSAAVTDSQNGRANQQNHCKKKQETFQNPDRPRIPEFCLAEYYTSTGLSLGLQGD